jgi:hypothetical protein
MAYHKLYHGGRDVHNPNQEMYPAANLSAGQQLAQAASKEPIAFGNTRLFDFSQQDERRQAGLQQYLERLSSSGTPLAQGDIIGASVISSMSLLIGYAWAVEKPEPGVAFNLKLHFSGTTLESVNAGAVGSNANFFSRPLWLPNSEILNIELTSFPPNGVNDLRFWVTPIFFTPKVGN